jgi:hypothetical protein
MKKIIDLFFDPVWVFSTIMVAIVVNIVSSVLHRRIDSLSVQLFASASRKKKAREAAVERYAKALRGRLEERIHLQHMQLKAILRGAVVGTCGLITLAISVISLAGASWVTGSVLFGFAAWSLWSAYPDIRFYNFLEDVFVRAARESEFWKEANQAPAVAVAHLKR